MFLGGCVASHTVDPVVQGNADIGPAGRVVVRRNLAPLGLRIPVLAALEQSIPTDGIDTGEEVTRRGATGSLRTVVEHGG